MKNKKRERKKVNYDKVIDKRFNIYFFIVLFLFGVVIFKIKYSPSYGNGLIITGKGECL